MPRSGVGYAACGNTRSEIEAEEPRRNCGNRSLARRGKAEGSNETTLVRSDAKCLLVQEMTDYRLFEGHVFLSCLPALWASNGIEINRKITSANNPGPLGQLVPPNGVPPQGEYSDALFRESPGMQEEPDRNDFAARIREIQWQQSAVPGLARKRSFQYTRGHLALVRFLPDVARAGSKPLLRARRSAGARLGG